MSGRDSTMSRAYDTMFFAMQALGRFWDHIGAMDYMVFEVAKLDGAAMICHTNSKMKGYLVVLNVSNWCEVA